MYDNSLPSMEDYLKQNYEIRELLKQTVIDAVKQQPYDVKAFMAERLTEHQPKAAADKDPAAEPCVPAGSDYQCTYQQPALQEADYAVEIPVAAMQRRRGRPLISKKVEVKNEFNMYEKSAEVTQLIIRGLYSSPLTKNYSPLYYQEIAKIMAPFQFYKGSRIIEQGAKGDYFYVLTAGKCDVLINGNKVNETLPGVGFGDLALLCNQPRAASIICTEDSVAYGFYADEFKQFLMHLRTTEVAEIKNFLHTVKIFDKLESQEKYVIAQACKVKAFENGANIINQGDQGDEFFFLTKGAVDIIVDGKRIKYLVSPNYFGEAALLHQAPRNATVQAIEDVECACLDRETFVNLLGPLNDILERDRIPTSVSMEYMKQSFKQQ